MEKKMSELKGLLNTIVLVEVRSPDGEINKSDGTLLGIDVQGIVFESKGKVSIIPLEAVIDINPFTAPRKVVRRKVQAVLERRARQHLLDRHGLLWDLIKFVSEKTAYIMHDKIDHSNLGHQHRPPGDTTPDEEEELK